MSTKGRRKSSSVIQKLTEQPSSYSFFQAVRLLERSVVHEKNINMAKSPVGLFLPPATESIRFHGNQSLSFPTAEISNIKPKQKKSGSNQWEILINFLGLTGSCGVLPYHYTELIQQRIKEKDYSLQEFFNLFNHRTTSLFYQSSTKYKLPIEYERKKLNRIKLPHRDNHSQALLSLIGLGTKNLTDRLYTQDESLLYYSGLFTQQLRTSTGLKQILSSHFGIPVQINEFIGQWQDLIDDVRTRLPGLSNPHGQNNCLGKSVMLGRKGWFAQGKISILLGPLNSAQMHKFSPGTTTLKALNELVHLYVGMEYNYDFIIQIKRSNIPAKIQLKSKKPPIVGWNTWLSTKPEKIYDENETLDIKVSANRFR